MRGTFVVRDGRVTPCLESDDTEKLWTPNYRIGIAQGLLFDPDEQPTVRDTSLRESLVALDPLPDCADVLTELVDRIVSSTAEGKIAPDPAAAHDLEKFVRDRIAVRPETERPAVERLAEHVNPLPF